MCVVYRALDLAVFLRRFIFGPLSILYFFLLRIVLCYWVWGLLFNYRGARGFSLKITKEIDVFLLERKKDTSKQKKKQKKEITK